MAQIETWLNQDMMQAVKVRYLDGNLFSQDNAGNLIGVKLTRDGEDYSGGGTVSANVIRADGGTVAVTGALSGNFATVVLPQSAYAVPGVVSIVVKLTVSGEVATIAAVVANIYQSSTDTTIDPGTIIPSIQTLIDQINTAVASIPADYSSLWTSLAPAFSTSTAYTAGQYVTYNGGLYRFTANHAAGAWSSSDVSAVVLGNELSDLKNDLVNNVYYLSDPTYNLIDINKQIVRTAKVEVISNKKMRIVATESGTYAHCMFVVPVSNISNVKITFKILTGATGSGRVRLGYSADGLTFAGWINTVNSGDTFDVSNYNYLCLALYAVWTSNTGIGHYTEYEDVMIVSGTDAKDYLPGRVPSNELLDIRKDVHNKVHDSAGGAVRAQITELFDEDGKIYKDIGSLAKFKRNLLYESPMEGVNNTTVGYDGNDIIVTYTGSTSSSAAYAYALSENDVSKYDSVVLSYKEITGDEGTAPKVRYGKVTGGDVEWIANANDKTTVIDTQDIDILAIGLYVYYNQAPINNTKAAFKEIMIDQGEYRHEFITETQPIITNGLDDVLEPGENLLNVYDVQVNSGAHIETRPDKNVVRVTADSNGQYSFVGYYINVKGIDTIYAQCDWAIPKNNSASTTPRIRIGALSEGFVFDHWLGDTNRGKSIDVSDYDYIYVALYAIYSAAQEAGHYVDYRNVMISPGGYRKKYAEFGRTGYDKIARNAYDYVPAYYFENNYLPNKTARINELCKSVLSNGDAFIFNTDQHWIYNAKNSPALIRYIEKNTNIHKAFFGGDLINGGSDTAPDDPVHAFSEAFNGEKYYVIGNHEYLSASLDDNVLSYWFTPTDRTVVFGDYSRHYYYVDCQGPKIRYIVLTAYRYTGSSQTSATGYEAEQAEWLEDVALGTLEAGWAAVIVTHALYLVQASEEEDEDNVFIMDDAARGIRDVITGYNGGGEIICVVQGHTHIDKITHLDDSTIPVIMTTCDKYAYGTVTNDDIPRQTRTPGTIKEQAIDVYVINRTNRQIKIVRIGHPASDGVDNLWGDDVEERTVSY